MNQHNDQPHATDVDPQVSDHYETLAGEKTPAELDRAVLREAARAVRADNRKGSFGAWFRPVAFMAMVGLSLAIILDLSDTSIFGPVSDMSLETAPSPQAPPMSTADTASRGLSQSSLNEIKRQEKSAPAQSLTTDAAEPPRPEPGQARKMQSDLVPADAPPQAEPFEDHAEVSNAFTAEAESVEQRVQEMEAAVDANLQSRPSTAVQFAAPQAVVANESFSKIAQPACSDEQISDAGEWWKCIASLRQSGMAEAADEELAKFRKAYPHFEPPE